MSSRFLSNLTLTPKRAYIVGFIAILLLVVLNLLLIQNMLDKRTLDEENLTLSILVLAIVTILGVFLFVFMPMYARLFRERKGAQKRKIRRKRILELLEIIPNQEETESERIRKLLKVITDSIGMQTALVSRIDGDANLYTIVESYTKEGSIPDGTEYDLHTTYCDIPYHSEEDMIAIPSMKDSPYLDHPCYATFKNESYIGTSLFYDDQEFGMLSFSAPYPVEEFSDEDKNLVKHVSRTISHLLTIILDKQKAQEAFDEEEFKFRSIFDSTYNFTGLLDKEGILLEANKSALDFGGFSIEQARGLHFADAPWWSLSEEINRELRESLKMAAQGKFIRYDVQVVGVGGKVITIDFSITPIFDEEGEVTYLVPEGRDITERIALEKEVSIMTERLLEAQKIARIGNWNWDMEEDVITWSHQNYQIFGQEKDFEPNFESLMSLTHPDDREPFKEDVDRAIKEHTDHDFIHRIVLNDGKEVRYIHERGEVFYDEKGKPIRMAGTSQDVTEIKKREEAILLERKQLQEIISKAPVAAAMLDTNMKYITASEQWYEVYQIPDQRNIIGLHHTEIFSKPTSIPKWLDYQDEVMNGTEMSDHRYKFELNDGKVQWLSWKLLPYYDNPEEIGGAIIYTSDITAEVEYRQKIEHLNEELERKVKLRTQELKQVNEELESFSYSISHDLRAPLRSINGFADVLKEEFGDQLEDEGLRLLGIIKDSGIKMGTLIDDILTFSRLGRKELKTGKVELGMLCEQIIKEAENTFPEQKIEIKMTDLPTVKADLSLIRQVFINLLFNAVKYSSKEEVSRIDIRSTENEEQVVISIKDNGTGFDMKYHDKMFGVFQRLHSSNSFEGTGVGLAIVKRIINKHGGEVWAEGVPEEGSTFYISLPKN